MIDGGLPFVQATYQLEGDDALIFTCFDELNTVYHAIEVANLPNVNRIAQKLANGNQVVEKKLIDYAMSCIKPAHDYFFLKFHNDLQLPLAAFKAAQLFSPAKVKCCKPVAQDVDAVKAFPFLCDNSHIEDLKAELPKYLTLVDSTTPDDPAEILPWWKQHSQDLPNWSRAASLVILVQPSSAAAESVLSTFSEKQDSSLQDYVETSLMPKETLR